MPYIQPLTNNIFGLMPVNAIGGGDIETGLYSVSSSEATVPLPGDAIVLTSIGTVRVAVSADVIQVLGAAAATLSTASFAQGTLNLLVYNDPQQQYVISNTTSANMTLATIGQNVGLVTTSTGTGIPSTSLGIGRSKMALSATVTTSAAPLRILGLHPVETFTSSMTGTTSSGGVFKWIVRLAPGDLQPSNLTT